MTLPIGVQMHTLRAELAGDFHGTIARVAEIGYDSVEIGRSSTYSPDEITRTIKTNGLACHSSLVPLPFGKAKPEVLEFAATVGAEYIGLSYIKSELYDSKTGVKLVAQIVNEAKDIAKAAGLRYTYHNHHFEFASRIDGRPAYDLLLEELDDDVYFTFDTYWAQVGGVDPVEYVKRLGDRAAVLHLKDGPADSVEADMTALGDGNVDLMGCIAAGEGHTQLLMFEMDRCATDTWEAVAKSFAYLQEKGIANG